MKTKDKKPTLRSRGLSANAFVALYLKDVNAEATANEVLEAAKKRKIKMTPASCAWRCSKVRKFGSIAGFYEAQKAEAN